MQAHQFVPEPPYIVIKGSGNSQTGSLTFKGSFSITRINNLNISIIFFLDRQRKC